MEAAGKKPSVRIFPRMILKPRLVTEWLAGINTTKFVVHKTYIDRHTFDAATVNDSGIIRHTVTNYRCYSRVVTTSSTESESISNELNYVWMYNLQNFIEASYCY